MPSFTKRSDEPAIFVDCSLHFCMFPQLVNNCWWKLWKPFTKLETDWPCHGRVYKMFKPYQESE